MADQSCRGGGGWDGMRGFGEKVEAVMVVVVVMAMDEGVRGGAGRARGRGGEKEGGGGRVMVSWVAAAAAVDGRWENRVSPRSGIFGEWGGGTYYITSRHILSLLYRLLSCVCVCK